MGALKQTAALVIAAALNCGALSVGNTAQAQSLDALQGAARRCFSSRDPRSCRQAMELSHQLRVKADAKEILRCYTALLSVEAMLNLSQLGESDPARDEGALQQSGQECQALQRS